MTNLTTSTKQIAYSEFSDFSQTCWPRSMERPVEWRVFHRTVCRCLVLQGFRRAARGRFAWTKTHRGLTTSIACSLRFAISVSPKHRSWSGSRPVFGLNLAMGGDLEPVRQL